MISMSPSIFYFILNFFLSLQIHNIILITLEVLIFFFFVKLFYILIINYWFIVYKDKIVKYSLFIIIYSLFLATFSSPLHTNTHRLEQLMWLVQGVISTSYFLKYKPQKEKKFYYIVIHKIIFNDIFYQLFLYYKFEQLMWLIQVFYLLFHIF